MKRATSITTVSRNLSSVPFHPNRKRVDTKNWLAVIPKETIERIFDAARIDEVVGDFVNLKKRGVNLIGLCPFHNEKTPSFQCKYGPEHLQMFRLRQRRQRRELHHGA
jgi:hypothetical protein